MPGHLTPEMVKQKSVFIEGPRRNRAQHYGDRVADSRVSLLWNPTPAALKTKPSKVLSLGFRVQGSGFRGLGFRV